MNIIFAFFVAAATFGVCFLIDKCFTRVFRGKAQHKTGLSVRVSKRYAVFGLVFAILGVCAVFAGLPNGVALIIGGIIVGLMGAALVAYYMTFGIFYDADSFILTTFGKKSTAYRFRDIKHQQLYIVTGGNVVVELHLADGRAVSLQSSMEGTYPFLDHAFAAWCRQTGRNPDECAFHDPAQSLWFPTEEDA